MPRVGCTNNQVSELTVRSLGAFIVHCSCIAVSCSGHISVSELTTALQGSELEMQCIAWSCGRQVIDTSEMQTMNVRFVFLPKESKCSNGESSDAHSCFGSTEN